MIQVNAMGDTCPIPVVKTKKAIQELNGAGTVETLVDNEIAVQNLVKMAQQKGYSYKTEQLGENQFRVTIIVGESDDAANSPDPDAAAGEESCFIPCAPKKNTVVVISADHMGEGNEELGKVLIKGFIYALSQMPDNLPTTILFYNGGAKLTCEDSPSLDDLKELEAKGVEILTCGTCLNYYGLTDQLKVGKVTNMYDITEKMMGASLIVKP